MTRSVDCSVHFDQAARPTIPRSTRPVALRAEVPVIVQDPADAIVPTGQDAVFTTIGRGSPTPTVRWEVSTDNWQSFEVIVGETSPTLTIHLPPESSPGYQYRAVYENFHGSVTTAPATLHLLYTTVLPPSRARQNGWAPEAVQRKTQYTSNFAKEQWDRGSIGIRTHCRGKLDDSVLRHPL